MNASFRSFAIGLSMFVILLYLIVPAAYLLVYGKRDQQAATILPAGSPE